MNKELLSSIRNGQIEEVRQLLQQGVNVNEQGALDATSLHVAAGQGNCEMIELLLDNGANIEAQDRWDATPLHIAVVWQKTEAVRLLLERGADVEAKDLEGKTPLDYSMNRDPMLRTMLQDEASRLFDQRMAFSYAVGRKIWNGSPRHYLRKRRNVKRFWNHSIRRDRLRFT